MNKNVFAVFGIENYDDESLSALPGAKFDAERVYLTFSDKNIFDADHTLSNMYVNSTREEARKIIAELAYDPEIDTLSLYFAGHGGATNTGYYLCCKDTDSKRLSYSALALSDIFTILSSSPKKQVNLIIDACNAGGLVQDLSAIAKNPQMGAAAGISISIIALSSREQASYESASGGFGTTAFLDVVKGNVDNQSNKEFLSLGDIHQALDIGLEKQTSSFWSFNSIGVPRFCKNVYAANNRSAELFALPAIKTKSSIHISDETSNLIWKNYLEIGSHLDCRKLQDLLERVQSELKEPSDKISFLVGLFDSFLQRSKSNDDLFAPIFCTSVFLFVVSVHSDSANDTEYMIRVLLEELNKALSELAHEMEKDEFFLVREGSGGYSAFYSLPQRISYIAAWSLLSNYINLFENGSNKKRTKNILECLTRDYSDSFELMSEEQAPAIMIIAFLSEGADCSDWAAEYIAYMYSSYYRSGGKVSRCDLKNERVFDFLRHRISDEKVNYKDYCSRPTEVLLALLCDYWKRERLDVIKFDLLDFDGVSLNGYIPSNYVNFSQDRLSTGENIGIKIGLDLFTAAELKNFIEIHLTASIKSAADDSSHTDLLLALVASLIYPDRLPWFLLVNN